MRVTRTEPRRPTSGAPAARATAPSTTSKGWQPKTASAIRGARPVKHAAGAVPVQKPPVAWTGGVQHNGNNPEVIDRTGRSYSSRAFAPEGVPFTGRSGQPAAQQVFSSNKNMTGGPISQTLVLSNPGATPMRVRVSLAVAEPASARADSTREVVLPPHGSVAVPVAKNVRDGAFTAFRADVEPLDAAARHGRLHVDVASHTKPADGVALAGQPLMATEGERGYRIPPGRLGENPAFVEEARWVMKSAGVSPDPIADRASWPDAKVRGWVGDQQRAAAAGQPNAFDPSANRGIQGRVNGLVSATEGRVVAAPFLASAKGAATAVRLLPNKEPPGFETVAGQSARRPGTSLRDAGAYGTELRTTLPVTNTSDRPITVALTLRAPPVGEDGAQLPGHQIYNGPVQVSAGGAPVRGPTGPVRIDQPPSGSTTRREASVTTVTVPPHSTLPVEVRLQVHANSQFPLDLVATRTT